MKDLCHQEEQQQKKKITSSLASSAVSRKHPVHINVSKEASKILPCAQLMWFGFTDLLSENHLGDRVNSYFR